MRKLVVLWNLKNPLKIINVVNVISLHKTEQKCADIWEINIVLLLDQPPLHLKRRKIKSKHSPIHAEHEKHVPINEDEDMKELSLGVERIEIDDKCDNEGKLEERSNQNKI